MLVLVIEEAEFYDENKEEFVFTPKRTLKLEHSLLSVSKWETKTHKAFINNKCLSVDEMKLYIKCMSLTPITDDDLAGLSDENIQAINEYINDPATATVIYDEFKEGASRRKNKNITSEEIYYLMIYYGIPFECEKWHLGRLLILIEICRHREQEQNKHANKMSPAELAKYNSSLNAARRSRYGTRG